LRHVRELISSKWYDVGLELLEDKDAAYLRGIKVNYSANVSKACQEMLELWLDRQPEATWAQLIDSLSAPGIELNTAAFNIKKMLMSSTEGMFMQHANHQTHT